MTTPSRGAVSATAYLLVWAATLLDQFGHLPVAGDLAGIAMLVFLILEFTRQRRYAQILFLALTGIGLIGVATAADPIALFLSAWRRGAAYGAFFLALSSLRDAAETSKLVRRCGQHLVAQPPGRRYAALTGGGHLFGVILSYGAIELLGAMVMRANTIQAAGGSEAIRALRTRRMLMAIYRGFAVMNCWSPLNLMTAVVSTAVPAAPMRMLLPIAFVVSIAMAAIGWLEDRLSAARQATAGGRRPETTETWSIHLRILALVGLVMLLAELGSILIGVSLVAAVTLIVPLVGLGWAIAQAWRFVTGANHAARTAGVLKRRAGRFFLRVPNFRSEATVLAGSGFMGVAVGGALPAAGLAPFIAHLPPIAVPLLVPVLLIATGQLGLNPVAVIALLGAAMPDPAAFGITPAVLAFACMLGWGLAVNMTPMSASAITTARWAGVSPWTVSTAWNAAFTFSALVLSWLAIVVLFILL
ncbi:MAG: hypothetical protein P4L90_06065 [Rhodopila sp.]|nr:hypothetical protein [Rhodopila sp.]